MSEYHVIAFISAHRSKWYLFNISVVSSMDSKCCLVSVLLLSWGNPPTFSDVILLQWSERVSIFPVSHAYLNGTGNFCRFIVSPHVSGQRQEILNASVCACEHVRLVLFYTAFPLHSHSWQNLITIPGISHSKHVFATLSLQW